MHNNSFSFSEASDAELLLRIRLKKHDAHDAFSVLYDRYHARVGRYCIALLGKNEGYDAFQETFLRFYNIAQEKSVENIHAMLTTIARNVCLNLKRNRKPTVVLEDNELQFNSTPSASGQFEQQELMRLVEIGLEYLEFDVREAFVLRHYQELSYQEIALLTGVPETTVTKRLWRAKERLKHVLSPFINDLNQF